MAIEERRRSRRKRMVLEVTYHDPPGLDSDFVTNIGEGGIFINTNVALLVGQRLMLEILSPKLMEPLMIRGIVRWRRVADAQLPGGVGVEFVFDEEPTEQTAALQKLLNRRAIAA